MSVIRKVRTLESRQCIMRRRSGKHGVAVACSGRFSIGATVSYLRFYPYVGPLVMLPGGYYLWLRWSHGNHRLVILALGIPILFAYVIPGIGMNVLRLWELKVGPRLGRFRPHHGFVFGTAASMMAVLCLEPVADRPFMVDVARAALVVGSVLAFWNWLYDIAAIQAGVIAVYNRPYEEGRGPEAIATDYAPVLFGVFGACYGASIRVGQHVLADIGPSLRFWVVAATCTISTMVLPVLAFALHSYLRSGDFGLRPRGGP